MSDLHDARVEAAARALFHDPLASGDYTWEEMVVEDNSRAELWRDDARRVLDAADAVVTVEMIAKALFDVRDDEFDLDEWEDVDGSERERYICDASAVLALLRGDEARCRDCSRPAPARDMLCRNCLAKSEVGG